MFLNYIETSMLSIVCRIPMPSVYRSCFSLNDQHSMYQMRKSHWENQNKWHLLSFQTFQKNSDAWHRDHGKKCFCLFQLLSSEWNDAVWHEYAEFTLSFESQNDTSDLLSFNVSLKSQALWFYLFHFVISFFYFSLSQSRYVAKCYEISCVQCATCTPKNCMWFPDKCFFHCVVIIDLYTWICAFRWLSFI